MSEYKKVHVKNEQKGDWNKYQYLFGVPAETSAMAYHIALHRPNEDFCCCKTKCPDCGKIKK